MSDIIDKVQVYLNQVSKEPVKISDKLVEEFGEACKTPYANSLQKNVSLGFNLECLILVDLYANYRWKQKILKEKGSHTMLR